MFKKLLPLAGRLGTKALQAGGVGALYLGTATCCAAILLGLYLKYAWNIDKTKYYKMLAVAQGLDIDAQQKAAENRIAEMGYDAVLERRAERNRQAETQSVMPIEQIAAEPVPEPPKVETPPVVDDSAKISAFEKRVKEYQDKARAAGLGEETRLLENMDPEQAKEVIRKLWKDGAMRRVLEMLLAMEEAKRGAILYTMQQDKAEELKDLCDILQRIGNGEPAASLIEEAAKNSEPSNP
ncbi:MAG: hypothetical protein LBT46_14915 [Planctomycetaceae bacterium]|jgi:hypothetical protein|nr:hypothetical protein [Planctomycetaceae bacterium]